jgi:hypothetical protein
MGEELFKPEQRRVFSEWNVFLIWTPNGTPEHEHRQLLCARLADGLFGRGPGYVDLCGRTAEQRDAEAERYRKTGATHRHAGPWTANEEMEKRHQVILPRTCMCCKMAR